MNWFPGLISSLMRKNLPHTLYQSITGFPLSPKQVFDAGSRIQLLERYLNTRMGMCREDEVLPARFAAESPQEIEEPIPWEQMRETYYQLSGCDEQGRPTAERLRQFGLS
jgi:aldehyde:ferredoxin oxidoreductase